MGRSKHGNEAAARLLGSLPVPIVVQQDGVLVFANRATYEVTGYRPDEHGRPLLGRPTLDFVAPEEHEAALGNWARIQASATPSRNILRTLINPVTGRRFLVLASATAIVWRRRPALEVSFVLLGEAGQTPMAVTSGEQVGNRTARLRDLTSRERQVSFLVARGLSTSEIAARLGTRDLTVRTHLRNAYSKTRTHSRLELAALVLGEAVRE